MKNTENKICSSITIEEEDGSLYKSFKVRDWGYKKSGGGNTLNMLTVRFRLYEDGTIQGENIHESSFSTITSQRLGIKLSFLDKEKVQMFSHVLGFNILCSRAGNGYHKSLANEGQVNLKEGDFDKIVFGLFSLTNLRNLENCPKF